MIQNFPIQAFPNIDAATFSLESLLPVFYVVTLRACAGERRMTSIGNLGHRGKMGWALFTFMTRNGHMTAEKNSKGKDTSIKEKLVLVGILRGKRWQDQQRISEEQ